MICFRIFQVLRMYVLKSGLTQASISSHSSISRSACISWDREPLRRVYWKSHWWISSFLSPRLFVNIFYFGKNIVVLARHVSLGESFHLFCRIGLKNNCFSGNNILVLACLVSFWVNFFNLPKWTRIYKLVPLRCSCDYVEICSYYKFSSLSSLNNNFSRRN